MKNFIRVQTAEAVIISQAVFAHAAKQNDIKSRNRLEQLASALNDGDTIELEILENI